MAGRVQTGPVAGRQATGISGLDDVLGGGFPPDRMYLVDGDPGSGKTTLGMQFLLEGARQEEPGLYVTLSETREELQDVSRSHGWQLDGVAIHELSTEETLDEESRYTVFQPAEVELGETMSSVFETVERTKPRRVVFDSLSEMRLLARDPLRYRRQILTLKQFFAGRHCTVLLLDDRTTDANDKQLHSLAHGVVRLEQMPRDYGPARRRLHIIKLRGSAYREGYHDFVIRRGGLGVYPRLVATEHGRDSAPELVSSGITGLDTLLGGGVDTGSTLLFMGPAGAGKSLIVAHYAGTLAAHGGHAAIFAFDEARGSLLRGASGVGLSLSPYIDAGLLTITSPNPAELSPGEFVHQIRAAVEHDDARLVVIDSLNGYMSSMPEERLLDAHLHELFSYLRQRGVLTLLTMAQHGMVGQMQTTVDVSYLADAVVLLRYFEARGAVRRAISAVKRRSGDHEKSIRELMISNRGLRVGEPLRAFHGVLSGIPQILDDDPRGLP